MVPIPLEAIMKSRGRILSLSLLAYSNPNLSLTQGSPCIDAGFPTWYDPDETRSDIGAIYYNQNIAPQIDEYSPIHLILSGYSWGDQVDFSVTAHDPEGYDPCLSLVL